MVSLPRSLLIAALVGVLLACVGALVGQAQPTREAASYALARSSLDELGQLAGLVDQDGALQRGEPMAVELISDGGPMWALDSVAAAVAGSPAFTQDASPHLLRVELIDARQGVALQLHLWRQGWELREPEPHRVQVAPWAALLGGVLGALAALYMRRMSVGLATSGLVAQLALMLDPLPAQLFPPQSLAEAWASGPLFGPLLGWIRDMSLTALGVVLAVMAGSLVLVAFDHKQSRSDEDLPIGLAGLYALLGTAGAIAWVEAATRGSLLAACDLRFGAWGGWLILAGLIVAWLPAIRVAREAWHARAS